MEDSLLRNVICFPLRDVTGGLGNAVPFIKWPASHVSLWGVLHLLFSVARRPVCPSNGWLLRACLKASTPSRVMFGPTEYCSGRSFPLVHHSGFCWAPWVLWIWGSQLPLCPPPVCLLLNPRGGERLPCSLVLLALHNQPLSVSLAPVHGSVFCTGMSAAWEQELCIVFFFVSSCYAPTSSVWHVGVLHCCLSAECERQTNEAVDEWLDGVCISRRSESLPWHPSRR